MAVGGIKQRDWGGENGRAPFERQSRLRFLHLGAAAAIVDARLLPVQARVAAVGTQEFRMRAALKDASSFQVENQSSAGCQAQIVANEESRSTLRQPLERL